MALPWKILSVPRRRGGAILSRVALSPSTSSSAWTMSCRRPTRTTPSSSSDSIPSTLWTLEWYVCMYVCMYWYSATSSSCCLWLGISGGSLAEWVLQERIVQQGRSTRECEGVHGPRAIVQSPSRVRRDGRIHSVLCFPLVSSSGMCMYMYITYICILLFVFFSWPCPRIEMYVRTYVCMFVWNVYVRMYVIYLPRPSASRL